MHKAKISLMYGSWSGWNGGSSHSEQPKEQEIVENQELKLTGFGEYIVKISAITDTEVTLDTEKLSVKKGTEPGGISLVPHPVSTTLKVGETVQFDTPTTDVGGHWELTILDIIKS
jgi:hypothetical protein